MSVSSEGRDSGGLFEETANICLRLEVDALGAATLVTTVGAASCRDRGWKPLLRRRRTTGSEGLDVVSLPKTPGRPVQSAAKR